jgi:hypothetical protein
MKHFYLVFAVLFVLSCKTKKQGECDKRIVLDEKKCMDMSVPADWVKNSLEVIQPGLVIYTPPKAIFRADCYSGICGISVLMDSTNQNTSLGIKVNDDSEFSTVEGNRKWLLENESRDCFEFLHDCNNEVILKVQDHGAPLKDITSFNSFAEKKIGENKFSMNNDGITINDMSKNDFFKLTLEDNKNMVLVFRSIQIEEKK